MGRIVNLICDLCKKYQTKCLKAMRKHIEDMHGDFTCYRCSKIVNIRNLNKHEIEHVREDIESGKIKKPDLTAICCFCGLRRDKTGFHNCTKHIVYLSYKKILKVPKNIKLPTLKVETELTSDITSKKIILDTSNGMLVNYDEILSDEDEEEFSNFDSELVTDKINKLKKLKKYNFNPKVKSLKRKKRLSSKSSSLSYDSDA